MIAPMRAALALAAMCGAGAHAAQWSADPAVYLRGDQIYNPYLARSDQVTVYAGRVTVTAPLHIESESGALALTPRLSALRHDREKELNGAEAAFDVAALYESEYALWRLGANAARTSTWTSEWDDTGFVGASKWRITRAVQPSVQWMAGPETTVSFGGDHSEVRYADARQTFLVGYDYSALNAGVMQEFGPRVSGGLTLYATHMEAPRIDNTSDDYGMQFSLSGEASELWNVRVQFGGHRTHATLADADDWQSGATSEVRLTRIGERGTLDTTLSRSVSPSGFGVLVRRDQWQFTQSHEIAERIGASVLVRVQRDASLSAARTDADRRAARIEWRLNFELAPRWSLAFGVDYSRQRYERESRHAESSALLMQLGYRAGRVPLNARGSEPITE